MQNIFCTWRDRIDTYDTEFASLLAKIRTADFKHNHSSNYYIMEVGNSVCLFGTSH
jgi:hypothetical protein